MQNKRFLFILSLSLILVLSTTPAFPEDKPDWVDGLSHQYPDVSYLTGVGFGDARQAAEDSAYGAIAKIFRSEVHSMTHQSESFRQKEKSSAKTEIDRDVAIKTEISVTSRKMLEQVQIVDHWVDPVSKVHYGLAVLNRSKAASTLRQKLLNAESDAKMWERRAKGEADPLNKAKTLHKAVKAAQQTEEYEADLRVVSSKARSQRAEGSDAALLQDQLDRVLNEHFQVGVDVIGPHSFEVESAILEGLHHKGFRVGPAATLIVEGRVRFQKTGPMDPVWHYVQWNALISLKQKETGQIFGTILRAGREGQLSPEAAEQKALSALQTALSISIGDEVFRFIFGE